MKKLSTLIASLTLSFGAQAAWDPINEMILTVWNMDTGLGFAQDIGVQTSDLMNGSLSANTFVLDSDALNHVAGDSNAIYWNLAGFAADFSSIDNYGLYIAGNFDTSVTNYSFAYLDAQRSKFQDYAIAQGSMTQVGSAEDPAFLASGSTLFQWQGAFGGLPFALGISPIDHQNLELVGGTRFAIEGPGITQLITTDANSWVLDIEQGNLVYTPVPAAAWLFGTALLGLVGIKRR